MEEALSIHVALCPPRSLSLRSSAVCGTGITALSASSHLLQGSDEREQMFKGFENIKCFTV